ncbi:hypothetical protein [Roseicyclus persicicus]|uniref:Uncharacterized protein n=1 Tax=Roseicyclus persicicus TaxID=2650661 RepID=A0A7X6JYS2_9RHOB|nr:hypothetical protein [Roseibacterium persicicum]NKX44410.1 hypothetical protein [Roseibacterium persicicum]
MQNAPPGAVPKHGFPAMRPQSDTDEDFLPGPPEGAGFQAMVLWSAIAGLLAVLVVGVAVVIVQHPGLDQEIWPDTPPAPRVVD